jgi:amino acid adenylation domain-containing protein
MKTVDLLTRLREAGVDLWVEEDRLRYHAPKGVLTPNIRAELIAHKAEIMAFLHEAKASMDSAFALKPVSRDNGDLLLSFAQERLWFLEQLDPGQAYNLLDAVRFVGELDVAALERVFTEVVKRHEPLRTTFKQENGRSYQIIHPPQVFMMPVLDLRELGNAEQENEIRRLCSRVSRRPFDLAHGPLMRMLLLELGDQERVLILAMHHIISDGWSLGVLIREVGELYQAFIQGETPRLAELPIQYADYAVWQRTWLQGEVLDRQLEYWEEQLDGAPPMIELPADRPRPAVQNYNGAREKFTLPKALVEELKALSKREGVTLFMTLLAAFDVLLYRYTGQEDVVVGTPVAGRTRRELEGLIGFFVNTLVLRTDLSGNPTFEELLGRVQETALGAYAHQEVPFERLVEELQPERDLSKSPLFQVMFVLQNTPMPSLVLPSLILSPLDIDSGTAQFDLTLSLFEVGGEILGRIEYSTDLFDAGRIVQMIEHFQTLLEGVVSESDRPLSALPLQTEREWHQSVIEWNDTWREYPGGAQCLHELFEAQVERVPDSVAVVFEDEQVTYGKLNRRANRLAHYLRGLGVGPDVLVGVCVERSIEMVVSMLGILKAGGAYLPLDPAYPQERLAFMLEDAQAAVLLAEEAWVDRLSEYGGRVVFLGENLEAVARESDRNLKYRGSVDSLAYVLYTSGSTGRPKGVTITHRSVIGLVHWAHECFEAKDISGVLASTSICFDLSVFELFVPLSWGGKVILVENVLYLPSLFAAGEVTLVNTVPSAMMELLKLGDGLPASVRVANLAGEPLRTELVEQIYRQKTVERVYDLYGPSEDTTYSTFALRRPNGPEIIGRPIANTQIYLLDANMYPVPIGVPGEIYIGGTGLARCYLNRPGLTAERFIPDPFGDKSGGRLYRTGDLARYSPDGNIEFLGRIDLQVKVRGYRVELGEIETVLRKHEAVQEAVVVALLSSRKELGEEKQLVAYVVVREGKDLSASDLRRFLEEKLPSYMVPSSFVILEDLPLTPSGKVDRQALPEPEGGRPELESAFVAPRTPVEGVLAAIWAETLGVARVGVHDNFFELGGHSLLAVQLLSRVREAFQVDISLRGLFQTPTVAYLATEVSRNKGYTGLPDSLVEVTVSPEERYGPFPLTDVQQAYWMGRRGEFELGNVATHVYQEFETVGLDLGRFERALQRVIERHDMLRAVVREDGQQQVLEEVEPYRIEVLDLRGVMPEEADVQLMEIRERMSHQMLSSDEWPLFEIRTSQLDGGCVRLHVSIDALIGDAWSLQIVGRELGQYYADPDVSLPELELLFRDYVLAEIKMREMEVCKRSLEYWRGRIAEMAPAPELPMVKEAGLLRQPRFVRRSSRLGEERWRELKARAMRVGLTPSGVLLAAFAEVLAKWSKGARFTINLTLFNRLPLHPQVNEVVGDFTSLTLLEVEGLGKGFEDRARRIQERLWEDMDHRYVGGVQVLREIGQASGSAGKALMPVVFTSILHQGELDTGEEALGVGEEVYSISQTPQVWLDHQVDEEEGKLRFNWDTVDELFPEGLLDDMFGAYCGLLERLAEEEGAWQGRRGELVPVPQEQLDRRAEVNGTEEAVSGELLHGLFAAQVKQRPEQKAVVTSGKRLTYRELYERANGLGRWLRERGVRPNALVGVAMEKGWEQVVAVLGVLNAGAAYLPIEAGLPQERIDYLVENGEVAVVLTQPWVEERLKWADGVERFSIASGQLEGMDGEPLDQVQGVEDLAYVIYTSGSTGKPKGVMIDHRGAVNTILDINRRFAVTPGDRVLALSSLSFDLSVYDIFGILAAGGTIVMPDVAKQREPADWLALMREEGVSLWNSVPALMEMLVGYVEGREEMLPETLRLVFMSGDWIPLTLPERIRRLRENVEVWSGGGATEASIWSIVYPIGDVEPEWRSIPYGKPMTNQTFHVLDEEMEPRPEWVVGDLYIGGIGLARGYWKDEEKTAASFITHPRTGERLYRTGDMGRYLPDGNIEFLGREDFQVKVHGHRIELGEIESVLLQHPRVRAGVVTAMGDPRGDKRLVAYAVLDSETPSQTGEPKFQDDRPSQLEGVLIDPIERLKFKLSHPGLRRDNGNAPHVRLAQSVIGENLEMYTARRSYRKFTQRAVPLEQLGRLLGCLAQAELEGVPLPKYRYGSAGSLYPVQTYLYIKPGRVEGLAGGTYYYTPHTHELIFLSSEAHIDRLVYSQGDNRAIFDAAAFAIFLVGQMDAIRPMYGEWAESFCLLEAGAMTQLLEMSASTCQIGLCQIGGFDFEAVRHWFALGEGHVYLHSLLGGQITAEQTQLHSLVEDWGQVHRLLSLVEKDLTGDNWISKPAMPHLVPGQAAQPKHDAAMIKELQRFVQEKLPSYMVPTAFVLLESLPLTPNGKVDRMALPGPSEVRFGLERAFVAPRTPTEKTLASICTEVLKIRQIGVYDSFFELGGNSVTAVQIISRVRETFQVELPLRVLFEMPTVADLAREIDNLLQVQVEAPEDAETTFGAEAFKRRRQREKL